MICIDQKSPIQKFRTLYVVSLCLLGLLLICGQVLTQLNLSQRASDSHIVNIAGRQRMLSQKLSKESLALKLSEKKENFKTQQKQLMNTVDLWTTSHFALLEGNEELNMEIENSPKILKLFSELKIYFDEMRNEALRIAQIQNRVGYETVLNRSIEIILENEPKFLDKMNEIVFQYDFESQEHIKHFQRVEWSIFIIFLLVLVLEGVFIFHPMIKKTYKQLVDIQDLLQAGNAKNQALAHSEKRLRQFIKHVPAAVAIFDKEMRHLSYSDRWVEDYGLKGKEIENKSLYEVFPEVNLRKDWLEMHKRCLAGATESCEIDEFQREDGSTQYVRWKVDPWFDNQSEIGGIIIFTEVITEKIEAEKKMKEKEHQLLQSQKMESIGRLAGGVAHDFNNLLTVIGGYGGLLVEKFSEGDESYNYSKEIYAASKRASSLTRQLLAFSRQSVIEPKVFNVNTTIEEMKNMFLRLIGEDIQMQIEFQNEVASVKMDPGQFEQILLNLVVNARDAMPEGGNIRIETSEQELEEIDLSIHKELEQREYILISVSDSGLGIPEKVKQKIFEPFFTTKEEGKGTGLGLSTCFGIIEQVKGKIQVYSEVGHGTTFKVYLPKQKGPYTASDQKDLKQEVPVGDETILIAEDDDAVRDFTVALLRSQGYQVFEARNGGEALRLIKGFSQEGTHIDLLITDVIMPQINGRELAEKIRKKNPEVKVLFVSGYTDDMILKLNVSKNNVEFLQKPFTRKSLAFKVRNVLDRTRF